MTVWICQCLCPARHAIAAGFEEAPDVVAALERVERPLRAEVMRMVAEQMLNPWCGLCRAPSTSWIFETLPTRYATMQEARPEIARIGIEQAVIRTLFGDMGQRPN